MGQELKDLAGGDKATHVAEVIFHGEKIVLPTGMEIPEAVDVLKRRQKYLEETVNLNETFDAFPFDGALALDYALTTKYGWSPATAKQSFWGPIPPSLINVRTGPGINDYVRVSWGEFTLPGVEGRLAATMSNKSGRFYFSLVASIKRKDEATLNDIFRMVRERLKTHSIYRGKAIKMKFHDDDGELVGMPEPEFIDTDRIDVNQLILSDDVHNAVQTNLFTPITRVKDCLNNGIPIKRGVLLGGTYGTGKTLAATAAARYATDAGVTYLYIPTASDLPEAIEFAKQYQSPACVIFCEDVDRVLSGERDAEMDKILNLIDGIDTKKSHIIVVLTTNDMSAIEPAMLRPGRLDAVIEVTPPDAKAVQRLLRLYGGDRIPADTNLDSVSEKLAGQIPAIIAEVVNRAKLAQLRLDPPGTKLSILTEAALKDASFTMTAQVKMLNDRLNAPEETEPTFNELIQDAVAAANSDLKASVDGLAYSMNQLKQRVRA